MSRCPTLVRTGLGQGFNRSRTARAALERPRATFRHLIYQVPGLPDIPPSDGAGSLDVNVETRNGGAAVPRRE